MPCSMVNTVSHDRGAKGVDQISTRDFRKAFMEKVAPEQDLEGGAGFREPGVVEEAFQMKKQRKQCTEVEKHRMW